MPALTLALLRHGNTFGPGDKVVMVGKTEDLPLVESGREQALRMAQALAGLPPAKLFCAPLLRTLEYANILAQHCNPTAAQIDERLSEIDYGHWAGLTDAEITERGDGRALELWRKQAIWPSSANFGETAAQVHSRIRDFLAELEREKISRAMAVTSQGVMRACLALCGDELKARIDQGTLGISTGHAALLRISSGTLKVLGWNLNPSSLRDALLKEP